MSHTKPRLFALVIGIDGYQHFRPLKRAVADADAMSDYLRHTLKVPKNRIVNLRDSAATRQEIIDSFRDLQGNPDIRRDDPILIYFAGHGGEINAPTGWETDGQKIQTIIPCDAYMRLATGHVIHPIPDRTICALLEKLANQKGNNITVIFDCCHSSSGTRNDLMARGVDLKEDLPSDLDHDVVESEDVGRNGGVPATFRHRNLRSHILLAACGADEVAWEGNQHGIFTNALLAMLRDSGIDDLTYAGLMEIIPSLRKYNQNPHCEGHYKDRFIFNATLPRAIQAFFKIEQEGAAYKLSAGDAHGVMVGSEFTIHTDRNINRSSNASLCTLRVLSVRAITATLESVDNRVPHVLPVPAYARPARRRIELRVHFSSTLSRIVGLGEVQRAAQGYTDLEPVFKDVKKAKADVYLNIAEGSRGRQVKFSVTDALCRSYGLEWLPHSVPATPKEVSHELRSMARWIWHFRRVANPDHFNKRIRVEFFRLEEIGVNDEGVSISPTRPVGPDLNRKGIIEVEANPNHFFGVKIINDSNRALYPYLFNFDVNSQSIVPYYSSPTGRDQVDPPLRPGSFLTIGYGPGGGVPYAFDLEDAEDVGVTYLKFFLTTSPTDFSSIQQAAPFGRSRDPDPFESDHTARKPVPKMQVIEKMKTMDHWGTVSVAVVQRRALRSRGGTSPYVSLVAGPSEQQRKRVSGVLGNAVERLRTFLS